MKRILAIALAFCVLSAVASAQTPSPIMAHYRAYQAALERNDLPAAEASAAEALVAAEAAADARAGALALNLATVRFLRGDARGAIAPAQRAVALAEQTATGGPPIEMARLILARAELASGAENGPEALRAALDAAQPAGIGAHEIYDGAIELASWAVNNQRYDIAIGAWSLVDEYAEGSRYPLPLARARAKIGLGSAIVLEELRLRPDDRFDPANAIEAYNAFTDARILLASLPNLDIPTPELTIAQQAYAEVVAWRSLLHSKFRDDELEIPQRPEAQGDADGLTETLGAPADLAAQRCWVTTGLREPPTYPRRAVNRGELAGLAVRLRVNAAGEVEDATVVARIGSEDFERALDDVRDEWYVERHPDSPPNCRMDMSILRGVAFMIGGSSSGVSPGMPGNRSEGIQRRWN